jgi:formyl-CoA transferase
LILAGIPCAPVMGVQDLLVDEQFEASGMLHRLQLPRRGEIRVLGNPLNLSDSPRRPLGVAPALGEHTRLVLQQRLGLSPDELDRLAAEGAI